MLYQVVGEMRWQDFLDAGVKGVNMEPPYNLLESVEIG